jgi:hypothetical protein
MGTNGALGLAARLADHHPPNGWPVFLVPRQKGHNVMTSPVEAIAHEWLQNTIAAVPIRRYIIARGNYRHKYQTLVKAGKNTARSHELDVLSTISHTMRTVTEDFLVEFLDHEGHKMITHNLIREVFDAAVKEVEPSVEVKV